MIRGLYCCPLDNCVQMAHLARCGVSGLIRYEWKLGAERRQHRGLLEAGEEWPRQGSRGGTGEGNVRGREAASMEQEQQWCGVAGLSRVGVGDGGLCCLTQVNMSDSHQGFTKSDANACSLLLPLPLSLSSLSLPLSFPNQPSFSLSLHSSPSPLPSFSVFLNSNWFLTVTNGILPLPK